MVAGCIALLRGEDVDGDLVLALGGPPARWVETGGEPGPDHWLRVWAARGLLYAWAEPAGQAIEEALSDPAWRVREAALRVAAKRRLAELCPRVQTMRADQSARVRAAAARAASRIEG